VTLSGWAAGETPICSLFADFSDFLTGLDIVILVPNIFHEQGSSVAQSGLHEEIFCLDSLFCVLDIFGL